MQPLLDSVTKSEPSLPKPASRGSERDAAAESRDFRDSFNEQREAAQRSHHKDKTHSDAQSQQAAPPAPPQHADSHREKSPEGAAGETLGKPETSVSGEVEATADIQNAELGTAVPGTGVLAELSANTVFVLSPGLEQVQSGPALTGSVLRTPGSDVTGTLDLSRLPASAQFQSLTEAGQSPLGPVVLPLQDQAATGVAPALQVDAKKMAATQSDTGDLRSSNLVGVSDDVAGDTATSEKFSVKAETARGLEFPKSLQQGPAGSESLLRKQGSIGEAFRLGVVESELQLQPRGDSASGLAVETSQSPSASATQSLLNGQGSGPQHARLQMPVTIQFGHAEWAGQVAERAALMAAQKLSTAELQLDPPELGPLQVKVTVTNEQASVTFVSANAQVREALDQTAMRLRELLEQQGLDLLDVNVSDESPQQQFAEESPNEGSGPLGAAGEENLEDPSVSSVVQTWVSSGVDFYA